MAQRLSLRNAALRFQDGGVVPGSGRGDKIPAKYEPGEFVVSNDMIDDNPGLREQLSSLRAETLAARGKTVEEADAKAMTPRGLRAVGGFDPNGEWMGDNRPVQPTTGRNTVDPAERLRAMNQAAKQARLNPPPPEPTAPPRPATPPPILDAERLRTAGVPPPTSVPLPPDQAAAYNNSAEGKATARAHAHEKFARAGGGTNVPPAAPGAAPGAAAPGTASKLFGSADDWKNALKGPADSPHKTLRLTVPEAPGKFAKGLGVLQGAMGAKDAYDGIQEGDNWKAGVGAADALAGAALLTPAAPAAGIYLGARAAWDGAQALGGAINDRLSEGAKDTLGGWANQFALKTGLGGVDDSAKMQMDAEQRLRGPAQSSPPAAPAAKPDPRNPHAEANAAKIAASDAQNKAAGQPQSAAGGYGPIGDRTTLTNEQAATMNPAGRITATRGANGIMEFSGGNVSGQVSYNDADGKALAGGGLRGKGFSNFDVAPAGSHIAMGPNGYAFATSGSGTGGQGGGSGPKMLGGVDVSGLSGAQAAQYANEVRNAQRVNDSQRSIREAGGGYSGGGGGGGVDLRNPAYLAARNASVVSAISRDGRPRLRSEVEAENTRTKMAQDAQIAQMNDRTAQRGQDVSAETSRYGHDSSFAGTKYGADAQLHGKQMEQQYKLRQQQMMGQLWQESGGDPMKFQGLAMQYGLPDAAKAGGEMARDTQTYQHNAANNARKRLEGMAVQRNEKNEEYVNQGRLAKLESTLAKMAPNYQHLSEPEQAKLLGKAEASVNLLQGLNSRQNSSFWQSIGVDGDKAELNNIPHEAMKGAKLMEVGLSEGTFTGGGVARNDYAIKTEGGHTLHIPRATTNQGVLELLKELGVDISGAQK